MSGSLSRPVPHYSCPRREIGRLSTSRNFLSKSAQPFLPSSPSGFPFRCRSTSPDGTAKSVAEGTRHYAGARHYRPCHNSRRQGVGVRFFGRLKVDQLALPLASLGQRAHSGTRRLKILLLRIYRLHAYLIGFAAAFDMEFNAAALPQTTPDFLFNAYSIIIMENEKFYKKQASKKELSLFITYYKLCLSAIGAVDELPNTAHERPSRQGTPTGL